MNIWIIIGAVAIVLLAIFWQKRNAVWGGLTIGIIMGFIIAIVYLLKGSGFSWSIIGKSATLATIIGFIAELPGIISGSTKNIDKT